MKLRAGGPTFTAKSIKATKHVTGRKRMTESSSMDNCKVACNQCEAAHQNVKETVHAIAPNEV
eukprot:6202068-Pleurochrysis_carterae.AAC.1